MPIRVDIVTQEKLLFSEPEADMVLVPGVEGLMGVLPHHAPLLTTLAHGELIVRKGGAEESFIVYGGVVEVRPDQVLVLADTAESTYEVDLEKAREARENAERVMREGVPPDKSTVFVQELRRATLQEDVLRKIKSRGAAVRIRIPDEDKNGKK
ncbi:MAG: ATP synthase F1 subunit epsilon [Anaerolinea sp.]|nr:ATP synthase F1 subunit epsilon [Anaerolinea sp.]MCC6973291.1 ATP synthase F1 subunit epsilon [Anaerolineae bacterium]CAG1012660.1 F-type H+-transporting ATPase subunit epsilon [Anaerolineae bacterium]